MSVRKDEVQLEITANGNSARRTLVNLDFEAQKLKNTMNDTNRGTKKYIEAAAKLKEVENAMSKIRNEMQLGNMTLKELNKRLAELKAARTNIDPMTDAFKKNAKAIQEVTARKKELETGMGSFAQSMSRMKDQFLAVGVIGGITTSVYFIDRLHHQCNHRNSAIKPGINGDTKNNRAIIKSSGST